ncbi:unnamed protein product [Adineta steineri]|uniref:Uncharacterized protein n=1 Tax=Adineta steineri TaxID=433720 RepID=A0A820GZB3_9BILA|nr:unnamed protein product [Adineta steineri]
MGILMNTRGIVQLIVLNIGVELNILSPVIFAMFVVMATVLTFSTSPILYLLYRRKHDPTILEDSNNAQSLQLILEEENNRNDHQDDVPTVELESSLQRHILDDSTKMNNRRKGLHTSFDVRFNTSQSLLHSERYQSRRYSRMTLF